MTIPSGSSSENTSKRGRSRSPFTLVALFALFVLFVVPIGTLIVHLSLNEVLVCGFEGGQRICTRYQQHMWWHGYAGLSAAFVLIVGLSILIAGHTESPENASGDRLEEEE